MYLAKKVLKCTVFYRDVIFGRLPVKGGNTKNLEDVEIIERLFEIIPLYPAYLEYAKIRHDLVSKGLGIDTFDMLIGASAIQSGCTLITHNRKHFERIPNLQIEDWQI